MKKGNAPLVLTSAVVYEGIILVGEADALVLCDDDNPRVVLVTLPKVNLS